MILKLRMPTHTITCGWRMIDKIARVDWEFVDKTSELRKHAEKACMTWINSYPLDTKQDSPLARRKRIAEVHIVYEGEDKRHEIFYTDDMVYIMNNEGKTCDTINVQINLFAY